MASAAPTWTQRYRLGSQLNLHMDHACTLDELAAELGVTKQNAHTEAVLALGSLAWQLRDRLKLPQVPIAAVASLRIRRI